MTQLSPLSPNIDLNDCCNLPFTVFIRLDKCVGIKFRPADVFGTLGYSTQFTLLWPLVRYPLHAQCSKLNDHVRASICCCRSAQTWPAKMAAADVTPIGDITGGCGLITIKGRVTNSSKKIRYWENNNGSGTRYFFEIKDDSGETRCVCFNEKASELYRTIDINGVYIITNLRATPVTEKIKRKYHLAIKHDWELVLSNVSEIKACDDESVPYREYKLKKIEELRALVQRDEEEVVDVIGVCVHVSEVKSGPLTYDKDTDEYLEYPRVDLELVDDSTGRDNGITLTVWDGQALEIPPKEDTPFVVVVKRARLNNGGTLNSGDTNMIQINPELPERYELMKWFDSTFKKEAE